MTDDPPLSPAARYDALWAAAEPDVRAGRVALDPLAAHPADDPRRGLTLLARPASPLADALVTWTGTLRTLEPEQYYQPRGDLHLTVLAPFSATPEPEPDLAHLATYREAVAAAVDGMPVFDVDLDGVTLSTGAVLAQGVPRDGTLEALRDRLRAAVTARGRGHTLDRRYRLATAHLTVARFLAPLRDPSRFVDALAAARRHRFGTMRVTRLELVIGDWYQTAARTQVVDVHRLGPASAPRD